VFYTLGGTARNGVDYAALGESVTFPVGAASVQITITPIQDGEVEPVETVVLTLATNAAYRLGGVKPAWPRSATIRFRPVISIFATDAGASEEGLKPGIITMTRAYLTEAPVVVHYAISGTAVNGAD